MNVETLITNLRDATPSEYPDTDVRIVDLNGRVIRVFGVMLDGNGHIYIETSA